MLLGCDIANKIGKILIKQDFNSGLNVHFYYQKCIPKKNGVASEIKNLYYSVELCIKYSHS